MTFVVLATMPFDKVVDGQFVHATGYGIVEEDGYVRNLYEDDMLEPTEDDIVIDECE
jgi:hypothetical protein